MEKNNYLNEEKYQRTVKRISVVAIVILVIGLCIGGYLIYNGIAKPSSSKVDVLQKTLEEKRKELENKGVTFTVMTNYTDGEAYDLKIITNALDPSFNHCAFSEYKNNSITKEYCSAKNGIDDFQSTSSIIIGGFICFATVIISFAVFMVAKGRNIAAFGIQQGLPLLEESTEKITPIINKGVENLAPSVGHVAKEITKGIKEGLKDDKE